MVDDVLLNKLDGQPQPQIYLPFGWPGINSTRATLVVKVTGDPAALAPFVASGVEAEEPTATVSRMGPLAARVSDSAAEPRFFAFVITAFGVLAVGLATAGLYGVLSYTYEQRRPEFAVRTALGATRRGLLEIVLREGLTVTIVGLVAGVAAAAALARGMASVLFGVLPLDAVAFVLAPAGLLVIAAAACLMVGKRVTSFDVAKTLAAD